ncbi:MAG: class I SAM-dependent methyltransferase [Alphaproteobacteria bacterium]|nr:class I SAM-dependent methyltransferase [Alphaproteobacteria bacterium]
MSNMFFLDQCPTCGSKDFSSPFAEKLADDNTLGHFIITHPQKKYDGINLDLFRKVGWRVCNFCTQIFCLKRPMVDGLETWYNQLFFDSEHRDYDVNPLPLKYVQNQKNFADQLYDILDKNNVFEAVTSVLHFRCHAGFLLKKIADNKKISEVYGLEYFENPAKHAQNLLGAERVARITGPEPHNPFKKSKFDLILLEHFLTHAHNPGHFLNYVKSLLSDRGKIVVFNEPDHSKSFLSGSFYRRGINFFHKQLFTNKTLVFFLKAHSIDGIELPHPPGLDWAVANNSLLFVGKLGNIQKPCKQNPQPVTDLIQSWFRKHNYYQKIYWIRKKFKDLKRLTKRAKNLVR